MKICFFGGSITTFSGTSKPIFELARQFLRDNNEVIFITNKLSPDVKKANDIILKNEKYDLKIRSFSTSSLYKDLLLKRDLTKKIEEELQDVDIVHGIDFLTLFTLIRYYNYNMPIPTIYTLSGDFKLKLSDLINAGAVSTLNMIKPAFIFKSICPKTIFSKIFNNFDKIISTSDYTTREVYKLNLQQKKVVKIPISVNVQNCDNSSLENNVDRQKFLYFGSGSSIRGVPDVIKAFKKVLKTEPDAHLTLCFLGFHGIEEKIYKSLVKNSKVSKSITLKGFEPNIFKLLQESDAVVLPFRSSFGYAHPPLTILEGMMSKKPVISTYVGSIPEVISDGNTGFLVHPKDVTGLAQKMLLAHDKELMGKIGNQAREYVIKTHNIKEVAKKTMNIYKDTLEEFYEKK